MSERRRRRKTYADTASGAKTNVNCEHWRIEDIPCLRTSKDLAQDYQCDLIECRSEPGECVDGRPEYVYGVQSAPGLF